MKTKWIDPKKGSLIPVFMAAVLGLGMVSCEKDSWDEYKGAALTDPAITTEDFWVDPSGKSVTALGGVVTLEFPEGTVTKPTLFTVALFDSDQLDLDRYNMMKCGISLESTASEVSFGKSVQITLYYCLTDFNLGPPGNEENLTIYKIIPAQYAYSIGECTVDCSCTMINGSLSDCGFYAVGEP